MSTLVASLEWRSFRGCVPDLFIYFASSVGEADRVIQFFDKGLLRGFGAGNF